MTIPYNISLTGIGDQLKDHFKIIQDGPKFFYLVEAKNNKTQKDLYLNPKEFGTLCKIVFLTLTQKLPSLYGLTKYLNSLLKIVLKLDLPVI